MLGASPDISLLQMVSGRSGRKGDYGLRQSPWEGKIADRLLMVQPNPTATDSRVTLCRDQIPRCPLDPDPLIQAVLPMSTPFSLCPARRGSGHPNPVKANPGPACLVFPLLQLHSGGSLALDLQELSVSLPGMLPLDVATDLVTSTPAPPHPIPIAVLLGRVSLPYFGMRVKGQHSLPKSSHPVPWPQISSIPRAPQFFSSVRPFSWTPNSCIKLISWFLVLHLEGSESQKEIC